MKIIITEAQYKLIEEQYNPDKLYDRDRIVQRLKKAPKYVREYGKNLPYIECTDPNGNQTICTKLPQILYQYFMGNF